MDVPRLLGNLQCVAIEFFAADSDLTFMDDFLSTVPPTVTISPTPGIGVQSLPLSLNCTVVSYPAASLHWIGPSGMTLTGSSQNRINITNEALAGSGSKHLRNALPQFVCSSYSGVHCCTKLLSSIAFSSLLCTAEFRGMVLFCFRQWIEFEPLEHTFWCTRRNYFGNCSLHSMIKESFWLCRGKVGTQNRNLGRNPLSASLL